MPENTRYQYWTALNDYLGAREVGWRTAKPNPKNWIKIYPLNRFARPGSHLAASALAGEIRANFVLEDADSLPKFDEFHDGRVTLEREVGESLSFEGWNNRSVRRIYARKGADFRDRSDWQNQFEWFHIVLRNMHEAFRPRVA